MKIMIPYFGGERYRPLLDAWLWQYKQTGLTYPVHVVTPDVMKMPQEWVVRKIEDVSFPLYIVDQIPLTQYADVIRPGQPFDIKGALVCEGLKYVGDHTLVLDSDAVVMRDPLPDLLKVWDSPLAMPVDHGSLLNGREAFLTGLHSKVRKCCAGVMWFGRQETTSEIYHSVWKGLKDDNFPWNPRLEHLLEQNAFSLVRHVQTGAILPHTFNWSTRFLGENPDAVIVHDYGPRKMIR